VRDSIRLPGTSSPIQDVGTVEEGQVSVREPVQTLDASQKVIVSRGVGAVGDSSLGPGQDLTLDQWGPPGPTLGVMGERQDPTLVPQRDVSDRTLISCRPGAQLEPGKFPPRAQKVSVEKGMYEDDHDDYAVCAEMENVENVNPSRRDAPGYRTSFRAPVTSPEMQGMWDRSRVFQPIAPTYFAGPRDSPRSQESVKPKSKGSSRASSRVSSEVDLNWLGDFMTKFAEETTSREKRDLYLMRELLKEKDRVIAERERVNDERERRQSEMVMKREKEIRNDMKQLAASEARVAALQHNSRISLCYHQIYGMNLDHVDAHIQWIICQGRNLFLGFHHQKLVMSMVLPYPWVPWELGYQRKVSRQHSN